MGVGGDGVAARLVREVDENEVAEARMHLEPQGRDLAPVDEPDFSMITDGPFDIPSTRQRWHNFVDVQTAIEVYTPLYALMLPRHDFIRASNSLQLDEVVGIYIAKILGTSYHLAFIKNGHPMVALSTLRSDGT